MEVTLTISFKNESFDPNLASKPILFKGNLKIGASISKVKRTKYLVTYVNR